MANRQTIRLLFCTLMISMTAPLTAQNLVPNPNFETYTSCPTTISQIHLAVPWVTPTTATPDYFNACSNSIAVDVPVNYGGGGYQYALTGNGYAGCYFKASANYREYIQVQLSEPLEAGICYNVGFFMNLMNQFCGVNQAGLYISAVAPTSLNDLVLPLQPQITGHGGFYSDTLNWVEISGFYPALGGEQYITIGNFKDESETFFDPTCVNSSPISFYYIDSVYVIEAGPAEVLPLDLGPPVAACIEHEIDGESGDVLYYWSDGSHAPTLTVNSSGVYRLTITSGCAIGIDSVEVTILGSAPVVIDPGFVSICEGDTYTVNLDPAAGNYIWNDGTTGHLYSITQSGTYTVTLDDGCDLSSDDITVDVTLLPPPFDLGPDFILCEGDVIEMTLDPGMNTVTWQDGSTLSTYVISTSGIYSVTISNGCGETSDEILVTGLQEPHIDLGPDTLGWCTGDIIEYNFDPDLGDFLWSNDSFDPFFFILSPGTYSVTVSNECATTADMITVIGVPEPQPGLGDTIDLCATAFPYTLAVQEVSPVDQIIWSTGETTPQISISVPGTYTVTVSNVCYSVSDTVYLVLLPAPVIALPDTGLICVGDTLLLDPGISSATYAWQDGSTFSTFEVTMPGWYAVTVTTSCGVDHDSIRIENFPLLDPPDLGPDLSLCPGEQVTLFAEGVNVTYQWNDMSTADSLLVTTPGVYSVTIQDQCGTAADTIVITFSNTPPQVDLPATLTLCEGQSVTINANVAGVSYLWSDGTTNSSLSVTVSGMYSLTVSNACGVDTGTVMVVDGGTAPVIDLGQDIQLCVGDSELLAPDLYTAESWMWHDGSTNPTFLVQTTGPISIEVSNACGSAFDTLYATVFSGIPPLDLGNDTALCASDILILEITIPDVMITWFDGSHDPQITIVGSGVYTAVIENACGVSTDTLIVDPLPPIPQLSLGPDQFLCPGELATFSPGIPNVQYTWHDGTSGSSFSTTQPGLIILTISNMCGMSTDSVLITESTDGPQLNLGPDVIACEGDAVTIQSGVAGVTYTWQDGSSLPYFTTSTDAELILHIVNACGEDIDTIRVQFILPPDADLGPDTVLCHNEVLTLTSNVGPHTTHTWQDGSQSSVFLVTTSGVYSLQQTNICGTQADSITVSYQISPSPFSLGPDVVLCAGEFVVIHAPVTLDQLLWQDGSDASMITADQNQVYALTIFNACGSAYDEVSVVIQSEVPVVPFDSVGICPGEVLTLDAIQPFEAQYIWSTGASNASIDIVLPGAYSVTIVTDCYTVTEVIHVDPSEDCGSDVPFYIPNIFSPNGDQINDVFSIQFEEGAEIISVSGDIFDRWGNHVFRSQEHPFSWDGTLSGQPMNPGVYVYRFSLVYLNGMRMVSQVVTGDVTLIR